MVQWLPSSQLTGVPGRHAPVVGSQVSTPLQTSPSLQTTGTPMQEPVTHVSAVVHGFPSSQLALLYTYTQPSCGSQRSSVQGLPSSQLGGAPGRQAPVAGSQVSKPLQTLPSSQETGVPRQAPP